MKTIDYEIRSSPLAMRNDRLWITIIPVSDEKRHIMDYDHPR
ncbi:MAG: hypothetical protein RBS37_02380 [Bacteroidales bacterium]|nr:hypothetical protein [Bacteroidales bacterium]